jgi:hypothetical protein
MPGTALYPHCSHTVSIARRVIVFLTVEYLGCQGNALFTQARLQ